MLMEQAKAMYNDIKETEEQIKSLELIEKQQDKMNELNKKIENDEEINEKDFEIKEIEEENISENKDDRPTDIDGIIASLENKKSEFPSDLVRRSFLDKQISEVKDSLTLNRLINFNLIYDRKKLKKDYKNLLKQANSKLKNNKSYIFDSLTNLNKKLDSLLQIENLQEIDSKMMCSKIFIYIISNKLEDISVFIYFLIHNIYNFDSLTENNKQTLFNSLVSLSKSI